MKGKYRSGRLRAMAVSGLAIITFGCGSIKELTLYGKTEPTLDLSTLRQCMDQYDDPQMIKNCYEYHLVKGDKPEINSDNNKNLEGKLDPTSDSDKKQSEYDTQIENFDPNLKGFYKKTNEAGDSGDGGGVGGGSGSGSPM